jgi:hypothetical protein
MAMVARSDGVDIGYGELVDPAGPPAAGEVYRLRWPCNSGRIPRGPDEAMVESAFSTINPLSRGGWLP